MTSVFQTEVERQKVEQFVGAAPIFFQPWWLEAVAPGAWDYAVVYRGHEIAAVMPFVKRQGPLGQVRLEMPPLTKHLGPWLRPSGEKYCKQHTVQKRLMAALIDALPPHDYFDQSFHYSITNGLPFYWKGFAQTTFYTYVLDGLGDLDAIWNGFDDRIREGVSTAQQCLRAVDDLGMDCFTGVVGRSISRQTGGLERRRELLARVDEACRMRNAGKTFFVVDSRGRVRAAVHIVWTKYAAYRLLGGDDSDPQNIEANCLLLWEAMRFASTVTKTFDFGGCMDRPREEFFLRLGARQTAYLRVVKDSRGPVTRAISAVRSLTDGSAHG